MDLKLAWNEAVNCEWNYKNVDTDTEISFTEKDGTLYISFQGSRSFLDWLQNFMFGKTAYNEMEKKFFVHRGFIKKYKSVRKVVLDRAKDAKKVELRGFSQGAALATLAHEDISFHFLEPNTVVFGSPRVFSFWNKKILEKKFKKLINVRNTRDLVTAVPFVIMGFRRYGQPIIKKGKYFILRFMKNHKSYGELV